ncbi:MAG: ABC transporter ATP-binding protein [Burkholderiales bacterium]|nr:ABC transporter ATP-binding protein [Burkholderiales bacterium]
MSDLIVKAVNLGKTYRLYAKPHHRFLDMFGLLRNNNGAFTEHHALDHVNLEIRRGEKVAFIGRNGAGKSTLLKLIAGVAQPTTGTLEVSQGAHALLQIGSGFHPDFTGRQNSLSYLAHLGITGTEAQAKLENIVDFAELEEYIDQPTKTYSTGMVTRLMFATSTVIEPELLILDEILGVGDAYFSNKSFDRIREMCAGGRTTVLLVSHDIYSASRISDRMVWLDGGRVIADGPASNVMKAYEDSIRVQEESRLRRKARMNMALMQQNNPGIRWLKVDIRSLTNMPMNGPLFVSEIKLQLRDHILFADLSDEGLGKAAALEGVTAARWGHFTELEGVICREMRNYGTPLHRASVLLPIPDGIDRITLENGSLGIRYLSQADSALELIAYGAGFQSNPGSLPESHGKWTDHVISLSENSSLPGKNDSILGGATIHGTNDILITSVRSFDDTGSETLMFQHGAAMSLEIGFEIRNPQLNQTADLLVGFHRDGITDVCRFFTPDLRFDASSAPVGVVKMKISKINLANGTYTASLTLAKAGYYADNPAIFYAINPDVYTCLSRVLEIQIHGGDLVASGAGVVGEATWQVVPGKLPEKHKNLIVKEVG